MTGAVEAAVRAVLGASGAVGPVQLHLADRRGGRAAALRAAPLPPRAPRPLLLHLLLQQVPRRQPAIIREWLKLGQQAGHIGEYKYIQGDTSSCSPG